MSTEPFIGEIKILAFDWAPRSYALCSGQLMPINTNTALFSLLGTLYGGNGQTTFGIPDLRGRMAVGQGSGPGLSPTAMGEKAGAANVTLTSQNLPAHNHTLNAMQVKLKASSANADESGADGNFPATTSSAIYSGNGATANTFTGGVQVTGSTDISGSSAPLGIMNPYLVMNYSIAIYGIFPSRN